MRRNIPSALWVFILFAFACNSRDKQAPAVLGRQGVYTQFTITGEESTGEVTCVFQFFKGDPNGPTLIFEPGEVMLDGDVLGADSANVIGSYYEAVRPVDSFSGFHSVSFIDEKGITHRKEFRFQPFLLAEPLPEQIKRGAFTIAVKGAEEGVPVRIVMVDTAFSTPDVNDLAEIKDGRIAVGAEMLRKVTNGPIALQLVMEKEEIQKEKGYQSGSIAISYSLQGEFELVD